MESPSRVTSYVPGDDAIERHGALSERFRDERDKRSGAMRMFSRSASKRGDGSPNRASPMSSPGVEHGERGRRSVIAEALSTRGALTTSLLRLTSDQTSKSVKLNALIVTMTSENEDVAADTFAHGVQKMTREVIKREELADEMYVQLVRATRNMGSSRGERKAWELMRLFAALFAPSRDFIGFVSEYVNEVSERGSSEVQSVARSTLETMKRVSKSAMRRHEPTAEEIVAFARGEQLRVVISFLDGTFEDVSYDITTTVKEVVGELSRAVKLQNYGSFSVFTVRRYYGKSSPLVKEALLSEEHHDVGELAFLSDALGDVRQMKTEATPSRATSMQTGLLFKKRMFRETDESITEPTFILLSYVQAKHDFLMGNYPLSRDDSALLAALQVQAEEGPRFVDDPAALGQTLAKYLPRVMVNTRPTEEWSSHIVAQHASVRGLSSEEARQGLLRMIQTLPYGHSVLFRARRVDDPIGLLPGKLMIGVNKRGVHFFRDVPMEYLYTADLRDIMQFGSAPHAVFFKMRVSGALHVFQFETTDGENICLALQTHINDVMMKKVAEKQAATMSAAVQTSETRPNQASSTSELAEASDKAFVDQAKRGEADSRELREIRSKLDELWTERKELRAQLREVTEAFHEASDRLESERASKSDIVETVKSLEGQLKEAKEAAMSKDSVTSNRLEDLNAIQIKELQDELTIETERARTSEAQTHELQQQVVVLQQKLKRAEATHADELKRITDEKSADVGDWSKKCHTAEAKIGELVAEMNALRREHEEQRASITKEVMLELEELRELKSTFESQQATTRDLMAGQTSKIRELEEKYTSEATLRRRYFNMLEDMKGKIRVYARTRPLTAIEAGQNQKVVLATPDEYTCSHPWRGEKKDRSYEFDEVFDAKSSQEQVFEDTKYLVQSAIDGYNVCIFAYGQTGSGKTFTIYGDDENPGLTPRAIAEVMRCVHRDSDKCSVKMECYMLELYRDDMNDLLLPSGTGEMPRLDIKKDKKGWVTVPNATVVPVGSEEEIIGVIQSGLKGRKTAGTKMNVESSRSHLIFSLVLETTDLQTGAVTKGKLSFVDLAGSERVKKSGAEGDTLKEAQAINKSLSALGDVISALASEQQHIPYRNHKLTMLMSDSLGGNAKTLMFVNVSPTDGNVEETQNSLTYATRVRTIKNNSTKAVESKEVQKLNDQIAFWRQKAGECEVNELMDIRDERRGLEQAMSNLRT
ncbi:FERM/acyl-CoA-binding protein, 3-helical bundle [Ostreococcus tauri]|uniref:FERM/acyl-CoA-binding protein, 3-helical bundle n=1 Tax=Ostreococcus tauri TaxID=70448 RepID=Q00ZB4_OSTTA|nr:FERM/acyl-CoA-binding protein, 3-helical bundle [Ostreococcus tauri]OUS43539.1 kinesin-like calmodulin binding protein [Ostreococcus tauri]CAL55645.1 FERM/acyl-CoA-binding protein, 3-helical bundle [Ostreococcus tauri]|eukprot:XP_003081842.1 FERM/acyl-CoA-binding protein, 3-helical bundle [Ostreococcus tauri]